jgi:hypothetical protein
LHDVEGVDAQGGVLATLRDDGPDPLGGVGRDEADPRAALGPKKVEELTQRLFVALLTLPWVVL